MLTFEEAKKITWGPGVDSYSRMDACLSLCGRMAREEWLRLIGAMWTDCDNLYIHRSALKAFLGTDGPITPMMAPRELEAYEALPDVVTLYRGAGKRNRAGASWSLDRAIAAKFPTLNRYSVPDPTLYTATVRQRKILAVKLDREEAEVITFSARIITAEPINAAKAA